jgi:hypothetical protein
VDAAAQQRVRVNATDILGYGGAAAALAATTIAIGKDASDTVQALTGLITTIVLLVAGWSVADDQTDAHHRMRSVLWGVALLAWIGVVVVTLTEVVDGPDGKWLVVSVAVLAAALAAPLWMVERRSIQFIGLFVSLLLFAAALVYTQTSIGIFGFRQEVPDVTWSAVVTMLVGVASLVLGARSMVTPRRTAMVLGGIALILGALLVDIDLLAGGPTDLAIWAAIVASAIVVVVGNLAGERAPSGVGVAGLFLTTAAMVTENVSGQTEGIVVLVLGLVLLAVAVLLTRLRGPEPPAEPDPS